MFCEAHVSFHIKLSSISIVSTELGIEQRIVILRGFTKMMSIRGGHMIWVYFKSIQWKTVLCSEVSGAGKDLCYVSLALFDAGIVGMT